MKKYIFKRTLLAIPILFVVSLFIFCMLRLNGTDAAMSYLNASGITPTKESLAHARAELGLDKPILTQYSIWLQDAVKLNLGKSYITGRDVSKDIGYYFSNSIKLVLFGLFLTFALSLLLGILGAIYKDKFIDLLVRIFAFLGVSTPNFWLGFILISIFSVHLSLLPPFGSGTFMHLIMPGFAISFMSIAINARFIRANMLENISSRHVMYAKMRGVGGFGLILKHVLKNALLPVITAMGMHFGELVGAAIVVENVFAYPGIGSYIITAIISNDYPVILAFMLLFSVIFIISNLLIDISYAFIDPRIRLGIK